MSLDVVAYTGTVYTQLFNAAAQSSSALRVNRTGINSATDSTGRGYNRVLLQINVGASIKIKKLKLEYGTESTLANDSAPNASLELIKCITSTADSADTYANKVITTNYDLSLLEASVGLQLQLKSDVGHTHTKAQITDFPTSMTPTAHTHTKANITDLGTIGAAAAKGVTDNTTTTALLSSDTNVPTARAVKYFGNYLLARDTRVVDANTSYTTTMARGISLNTTDLTAGTSALTNGVIYMVYE